MKQIFHILTVVLLVICSSCDKPSPEIAANAMLEMSRQFLQDGNYDAARDTLLSMRQQYPTAIETRKQGILLLDSIEMFAALDSLQGTTGEEWKRLSIKSQFFERKLKEDRIKLAQ
jgi:hypothetical protein